MKKSTQNTRSANPGKVSWQPGTVLSPVPAVMVSTIGSTGRPNIITISWAGIVCSEPPMLSISVRPGRHSFGLLRETGEFVVNIPDRQLVRQADLCGVISGRDKDKFHETGLTQGRSETVKAPVIIECPINIECKIEREIELGSHSLFIAKITNVQVSEQLVDKEGRLLTEKAALVGYAHGHYYQLGKQLGHFGFSVKKN
ncbi:MAG: flavin reductase family protein [Candidatus Riflebacteria bacterium]|nr:flavin reductase family protein [Candidatus Riflebacteria bacterium]